VSGLASQRLIHELVATVAAAHQERPAVRFLDDATYSYREVEAGSRRFAGAVASLGVAPGDRIATFLGNRIAFVHTWLGSARCGTVLVPLNTSLRGNILVHMLRETEPALVVSDAAGLPILNDALREARLDPIIVVDGEPGGSTASRTLRWTELQSTEGAITRREAREQDLVTILYTSGTTGPSKGAMASHGTLLSLLAGIDIVANYEATDVIHTALPLYHGNALLVALLSAFLKGGLAVIAPRFSASKFWEEVAQSGATTTTILGAMPGILWKQAPSEWEHRHHLRLVISVPKPKNVTEFEQRFGIATNTYYGLSDAGLPLAVPYGIKEPEGACGIPTPDWEANVVDDDDRAVAPGAAGELVLRPRVPFAATLGYWRRPEATAEAWRSDWFHTGDIMRRDGEGWFYYVDRKKDAIRRAGENISSFEVEQVLLSHPDVDEVAVYGVPSDVGEEDVMAALILKPSARTRPEDIIAFCEPRLPYFAIPRYIQFCETFPRAIGQKPQKAVLRAQGVPPTAWDRGRVGLRYGRPSGKLGARDER
jgi:carnitine-CoA ligase